MKFDSITGISLTSAKGGELATISFRSNCNDNIPDVNKFAITRNILDDLIYPEVFMRIHKGSLSDNFKLRKAHILMYSNKSQNKILLNKRAKFQVQVKLKNEEKINQKINEKEIEEIIGIYPDLKNDHNAAHIMLFKLKGKWNITYDLTYNIRKSRKNNEKALKEIESIQKVLDEESVDNIIKALFNATKLSIQSILILNNTNISIKTNYLLLNEIFSDFAKNGNIDIKFSIHFERLIHLFKINQKKNKTINQISTSRSELLELLKLSKELTKHIEERLLSIEFYRKPPAGLYLQD